MKLAILGLILASYQAQGYVVLPGSSAMRTTTKVSMASTTAPPATRLSKIKSKQLGRYDLESMADEESEEITSYDSFAEADAEETNPPKAGETITGTVIEMDDNGALLSITGKMSAYIPLKEASLSPIKHVNELFQIGQEVTAECIGTLRGMPVMSLRPTQLDAAWEKILNLRAADTTFDTTIIEVNRGGAVCEVEGLRGFIPGSHIRGNPDESFVGRTVSVKLLDVIEDEGKIVVSQKRAMAENAKPLVRGSVMNSVVTGIRPFGAFMEMEGGQAGLLHISQISADRVENLESFFTVGQEAKVMILEHDLSNGRVALSTKTLEGFPGEMCKDMAGVFARADETAKKYHERLEAERTAREAAAKDIVASLGGAEEGSSENVAEVAESIESILASIVSEKPAEGAEGEN